MKNTYIVALAFLAVMTSTKAYCHDDFGTKTAILSLFTKEKISAEMLAKICIEHGMSVRLSNPTFAICKTHNDDDALLVAVVESSDDMQTIVMSRR